MMLPVFQNWAHQVQRYNGHVANVAGHFNNGLVRAGWQFHSVLPCIPSQTPGETPQTPTVTVETTTIANTQFQFFPLVLALLLRNKKKPPKTSEPPQQQPLNTEAFDKVMDRLFTNLQEDFGSNNTRSDYDGDGDVDAMDLGVFRNIKGFSATRAEAEAFFEKVFTHFREDFGSTNAGSDFDGDGDSDAEDFALLRQARSTYFRQL